MRTLVLAVTLSAVSGFAATLSLDSVGPSGVDAKAVRGALGAWPSAWPACVPDDAPDVLSDSIDWVVQPNGALEPGEGMIDERLDRSCLYALLSLAPPLPKTVRGKLTLKVTVHTTAKERGELKARHLAELKTFCAAAQKQAKKGATEPFLEAARTSLKLPLTVTGRTAKVLSTVMQTNPADHLTLLQASAKEAGGTFDCPMR